MPALTALSGLTTSSRLDVAPMMPRPIEDENPESDTKGGSLIDQVGALRPKWLIGGSYGLDKACPLPPLLQDALHVGPLID